MKKMFILLGLTAMVSARAELVQQFKDPTFSGNGWASQVLTLEQMRQGAKAQVDSKAAADKAAADAAAANTPLAKFVALFTSQVYAQLATQLSNNLFAEGGTSRAGNFVLDGNTISYVKSGTDVTLTVVDKAGNQTVVTVPIATFAF